MSDLIGSYTDSDSVWDFSFPDVPSPSEFGNTIRDSHDPYATIHGVTALEGITVPNGIITPEGTTSHEGTAEMNQANGDPFFGPYTMLANS